MRKRHRWIDKRRHRKALGLQSPQEMIAALHVQITQYPGYRKAFVKALKQQERLMMGLIAYHESIRAPRVTP